MILRGVISGKIDPGESAFDAAMREILEERGTMNSPEVEHCIDLLEQLFINRKDTYSLQTKSGAYMRIRSAITRETIGRFPIRSLPAKTSHRK